MQKPQSSFFSFWLLISLTLGACSSSRQWMAGSDKPMVKAWTELGLASQYHVGVSIYDPEANEFMFDFKGDNFFTPASNAKILTMYTALDILGDHLDAAWYTERNDSLIIWGGGDPGTLYPSIDSTSALTDFIRESDKTILISNSHFKTPRFGKGWAWDDFPYAYQCERTAMPIYGNRLWINRHQGKLTLTPAYLNPLITIIQGTSNTLEKSAWGDSYTYTYHVATPEDLQTTPITFFKNDTRYCWSEASGKSISLSEEQIPDHTKTIAGSSRDSLLKIMMQESDNFIAEQLLLACSMNRFMYMSEDSIIQMMMNGPLIDVQSDIKWVDGSGLSRYNQMTPHGLIRVLQKILELKGMDYIKHIFPAGGKSGTIKNWYAGEKGIPYVYAKTGTLRNNHCLSGFLITASGKTLIFSWMHNQIPGESEEIKVAMEKFFSFLYERY